MHPTLNREKCYLLVRVGILFYPFTMKRGDVILAKNPRNPDDQDVVKRIIGMEDDEIIRHPRGWRSQSPQLLSKQIVEKDKLWLQGDNMNESCDSRTYGQVDKDKVYGKVICQIYPKFRFMKNTMEYAGQGNQYRNIVSAKSKVEKILVSPVSDKN